MSDEAQGMRDLLTLLDEEPDLMPPASRTDVRFHTVASRSRVDEGHLCLKCGQKADAAVLSCHVGDGRWRWLDLCHRCLWLLQTVVMPWDD